MSLSFRFNSSKRAFEYTLSDSYKYVQLIDADESVAQEVVLDTEDLSHISVVAKATTATIFHLFVSNNNTNWIEVYTSASAETSYIPNPDSIPKFRYIKLSSDPAGTSGTDTVTLSICAKP